MPLLTFSVVLTGESFPVQSIKTADFKFRHRDLTETMRVPVALQAENAFVAMQILPERFEVIVKSADHVTEQVAGVTDMLNVFLEYVGKRTVTALGHNAQWLMKGSDARKSELVQQLTRQDAIAEILGANPAGTDVAVKFSRGSATQCQATFATMNDGDIVIHFNFHHDLSAPGATIEAAISGLAESLRVASEIGESADSKINGVVAS